MHLTVIIYPSPGLEDSVVVLRASGTTLLMVLLARPILLVNTMDPFATG